MAARLHRAVPLVRMALAIGFSEARAEVVDQEKLARRAGLPDDATSLFRGTEGSCLLFAWKPTDGRSGFGPTAEAARR